MHIRLWKGWFKPEIGCVWRAWNHFRRKRRKDIMWRQVLGLALPFMAVSPKGNMQTICIHSRWLLGSLSVHGKLLWEHQLLCGLEPEEGGKVLRKHALWYYWVTQLQEEALAFFLIKIYFQRHLNNYKIQFLGHEISKSEKSQGRQNRLPNSKCYLVTATESHLGLK